MNDPVRWYVLMDILGVLEWLVYHKFGGGGGRCPFYCLNTITVNPNGEILIAHNLEPISIWVEPYIITVSFLR